MARQKDNAIARAESAFRRFQPSSTSNNDSRAWYACARKDFDRLVDSLTTDKIETLKSLLDCLADARNSDRAESVSQPTRLGVSQHADLWQLQETTGVYILVDSAIPDNEDSIKAAILLQGPGFYRVKHYSDNARVPYRVDDMENPV